MRLHLIRHGDAVPQKGKGIQYPLSPLGRRQAELLAERLVQSPPNYLYASPILRAKQTAEVVSSKIGREIAWDERFREIDTGNLRELTREQRKELYPHLYREGGLVTLDFTDVGGEGPEGFSSRISASLEEVILRRHAGTNDAVALIVHGGVINAALTFFLDMPFTGKMHFRIQNTSISSIRMIEETPMVLGVNDHAHLASLPKPAKDGTYTFGN